MKKKYYLIIGFVIILLISCGKKRKPSKIFEYSEQEINKIKKIKSEKEIMALKKEIQFNDMKEKRYDIWGIFDYNDKYIIYSKYYNGAEHPFLYDRNGNFIDKIGTFGKGPGEYIFLHSVFLKSEKDICAFDLQRNIMLFYEIKDGKVEFIEQKNLEKFFQGGANEVFYRNNKYYFLSFSGPKGGYKIYVTDENFKLINKFFKRKHEPSLIDIRYFVSDNKIFFLGACEFIKSKRETRYFEPKIYIYTLDGK